MSELSKIGHYKIIKKISEGGMGEVYLAEDLNTGRKVAIKTIRKQIEESNLKERLKKEAIALSKLVHPNIAVLYEFNTENDLDYIAIEYIEGKQLNQVLREGNLEFGEKLKIAIQVTEAIKAAHSIGIVHRDIKPSNIMIKEDGTVKVIDFGIASFYEKGQVKTKYKMGSLGYIAPEVLLRGYVSPKSDIFSLGVLFYKIFTGKHPYPMGNYYDRKMKFKAPPKIEAKIPLKLKLLLYAMMREEPAKRPEISYVLKILKEIKDEKEKDFKTVIKHYLFFKRRILIKIAYFLFVAFFMVISIEKLFFKKNRIFPVVVKTFENKSDDKNLEFLSYGLASEIRKLFSSSKGFRVIPEADVGKNTGEIDEILKHSKTAGAQIVVVGYIKRMGNEKNVIIEAYKIDGEKLLKYEHILSRKTLPVIPSQFFQRLLKKLKFSDVVKERNLSPLAYELYLKAMYDISMMRTGERRYFEIASNLLKKAGEISEFPELYLAWSKLYFYCITSGIEPTGENLRLSRYYVEEGVKKFGSYYPLREWKIYMDLVEKKDIDSFKNGVEELQKGTLNYGIALEVSWNLMLYGNYEEAERMLVFLKRVYPGNIKIDQFVAWNKFLWGKMKEAVDILGEISKKTDSVWVKIFYFRFLTIMGRRKEAEDVLKKITFIPPLKLFEYQFKNYPVKKEDFFDPEVERFALEIPSEDLNFWLAECYSISGNRKKAMMFLKRAFKLNFRPIEFVVGKDPYFMDLKNFKEFRDFVKKEAQKTEILRKKQRNIIKTLFEKYGI